MSGDDHPVEQTVAFIVRVSVADKPAMRGTVERVRTGEKHPFGSLEALVHLITDMAQPNDP